MLILICVTIVVAFLIFKIIQRATCGVCTCKVKMTNKVVVVTGANTGIGLETARELAGRGAKVILACRDREKGAAARTDIIRTTSNECVIVKHLDFTSFKSVRNFADDLLRTETKIDALINNAGTGKLDNSLTEDNLPIEVQVNHFSPFLLTMLLLPLIKKSAPARIINVSSVLHKVGKVNPKTFHKPAANLIEYVRVYSDTKLANALFTVKLSEELRGTGVTANCLHPGAVATDMFRQRSKLTRFLIGLLFKTPREGAQTSVHLAVSPDVEGISGKYFCDCREAKLSRRAQDLDLANELWDLSKKVTLGS